MCRVTFAIWAFVLSGLWLVLNWPRDVEKFGFVLWTQAGFPWPFVIWQPGHPARFDATALLADLGLGTALVLGLAWGCVRYGRWR